MSARPGGGRSAEGWGSSEHLGGQSHAKGGTHPQQRAGTSRRFQGHPEGARGSGEGDEQAKHKWEGAKVAGADLLWEAALVPSD